jgi:hypothetical protein
MRGIGKWAVAAVLLIACSPAFAQHGGSIQVRVTASPSHDAGYSNMYKYTFRGSWNLGPGAHGTGDLFVQLRPNTACPCVCSREFVRVPAMAGTATGSQKILGRRCAVSYTGRFACTGDATIGSTQPTLHFEPMDPNCENAATRGSWSVYSPVPPAPYAVYAGAVVLRTGFSQYTGSLAGQLPDCRLCIVVGVATATWSVVKELYK